MDAVKVVLARVHLAHGADMRLGKIQLHNIKCVINVLNMIRKRKQIEYIERTV